MEGKEVIKLGKLVDGKLKGFDSGIIGDLDRNIVAFLRDIILYFRDNTNGYPKELVQNFDENGLVTPEEDDAAAERWAEILTDISDKLNYYLIDTYDLLCEEEHRILESRLSDMRKFIETDKHGWLKHYLSTAAPEEVTDIYSRMTDLEQDKKRELDEAFDLIKKWIGHFWD